MLFNLDIDANVELAETPIWDTRLKVLLWTDLFTGDIHEYNPVTKKEEVYITNQLIGSAIPCDDESKILCALDNGLHILDKNTKELHFLVNPEDRPENRYNDTRCDSKGRIFTSSVAKAYGTDDYESHMTGAFYMIDQDLSVKKIVDHINQYNAIVWNQDETLMYVVDTYNEALLAFDYDINIGPVSEPRVVISFKDKEGMPDGMSIDENDNLYICHWSKKISIWNVAYYKVDEIEFPVEYVCCGGFAGDDLKDFYVATSKYCYTEEDLVKNKGAGGIFKSKSDIAGRTDHYYKTRRSV